MTTESLRRGKILQVGLDRSATDPLYSQVYQSIRTSILSGRLSPGARLPSTRHLASDLGVARSTVVQAFEQLRAEGYVQSFRGAATCVRRTLPEVHLRPAPPAARVRAIRRHSTVSERAREALAAPHRSVWVVGRPPRAFRAGVPAVDVFPIETWGKLLARRWSKTSSRHLAYGDPFGYQPLRVAVADYLRAARGVRCSPEQVLITSGSQQAIDLCGRVLLDPGDTVWLEDPGYHGARGAMIGAGAHIAPIPVDDQGLIVRDGIRKAPNAKLAFVTPSRQLPLGVTLSLERRLELLEWAAAGRWILEDDYDSEFRYASRPLAALQGLDEAGCVLYTGTFSKVMLPALRLGYLVVPENLIEAFAAVRHFVDYSSPYLEQAVMADFIVEGHFERHIRRMRSIYQERQKVLIDGIQRELSEYIRVEPADAGMTTIAWLNNLSDVSVAKAAALAGIDVLPLTPFAMENQIPPAIVLGYAGVRESEIRRGISQLGVVLKDCTRSDNERERRS